MKKISKQRISINLLIAMAISLVVNFSYLLLSIGSTGAMRGRDTRYMSENPELFIWIQVAYWFLLAFILICVATGKINQEKSLKQYIRRIIYCCIITVIFYLFTPVTTRAGEISVIMASSRLMNPMVILKSLFTLIVAVLYGKIFELVYQKQSMIIENEQLKNENLLTRYNILINQINPHFFFNSLNSLSMLVREGQNDKALTYIDRLSDTFRHIIQKGRNEMSTLSEELEFMDGYKYVHEVRYAGKLFFDMDIDEHYGQWLLPALSLQPLIENAVKHNSITLSRPFHISIRTSEGNLVVSNPIIPKMEKEDGTGTGLKNLSSRFMLLTGKDITVEQKDGDFVVTLPLTKA